MAFIFTTTGTANPVVFPDLGKRSYPHPTTSYDLELEYTQEEIDKIDTNIAAIDQKVAHVNANPQEKQNAEANGWFQDMENIKSELLVKKTALLEKQAKL